MRIRKFDIELLHVAKQTDDIDPISDKLRNGETAKNSGFRALYKRRDTELYYIEIFMMKFSKINI